MVTLVMTQTPPDRPVKGWVTEIVATTPRPGLATVKVQALSRRMTGHAAMCPEHRSDWVATRRPVSAGQERSQEA